MNSMKFYEQDKYFMEKMKYLNKGRNKNKNNNFQTCRTVRDSLTVKKSADKKNNIEWSYQDCNINNNKFQVWWVEV